MLVRVAPRVLATGSWHPFLDTIAAFILQTNSPHWFDPLQAKEMASSEWLREAAGLRSATKALIMQAAKANAMKVGAPVVAIEIDDRAPHAGETQISKIRIHPMGSLFMLTQPLHLLVEDETSDGGFVLWMAKALGRDQILRAYTAGALAFRHAGGKGQFSKSAKALSYGAWPREGRPIRTMTRRVGVMLDSDDRFPGEGKNQPIVREVSEHVAFVHSLSKRTIENYAPERFVRARMGAGRAAAMAAFFAMSEDQRRHFPMKLGYRNKATPPVAQSLEAFKKDVTRPLAEKNLFGTVAPAAWPKIAGGFGDGLSAIFTEPSYRCDPNSRQLFDRSELIELDGLLDTILKHL